VAPRAREGYGDGGGEDVDDAYFTQSVRARSRMRWVCRTHIALFLF
jgi:hypothetical protein